MRPQGQLQSGIRAVYYHEEHDFQQLCGGVQVVLGCLGEVDEGKRNGVSIA
jgi:hypothetical protein